MSARKTSLSMSAYTLDGNDHLGDLRVFGLDLSPTMVASQGLAATSAYNQETKRKATHTFELFKDNSGPKLSNLDVSVWNPAGSSLLGDIKSGTLSLKIPTGDGSGGADGWQYANVVGARDVMVDTQQLIPSSATLVDLLTKAMSGTLADRVMSAVSLTFGSDLAFVFPATMGDVNLSSEFEGFQTYSTKFLQRGALATKPTGTTLYGVAFAGDALISLAATTGHGALAAVGVISTMDIKFSDGQVTSVGGTLELQGAPTYS